MKKVMPPAEIDSLPVIKIKVQYNANKEDFLGGVFNKDTYTEEYL